METLKRQWRDAFINYTYLPPLRTLGSTFFLPFLKHLFIPPSLTFYLVDTLGKDGAPTEEYIYELYDANIIGVLNTIVPIIPHFKAKRKVSLPSSLSLSIFLPSSLPLSTFLLPFVVPAFIYHKAFEPANVFFFFPLLILYSSFPLFSLCSSFFIKNRDK